MFRIIEQQEGMGKNAKSVLCKRVTRMPGNNQHGELVLFPIKFPCLKVVIKQDGDSEAEQFEVSWSNFYSEKGDQPGKFKLKRIGLKHKMLYEKNAATGRRIKHRGNDVLDLIGMARKWGTEWDEKGKKLIYGEKHPQERAIIWEAERKGIDATLNMLIERFGHELAEQILMLFVEHSLYMESVCMPKVKLAA